MTTDTELTRALSEHLSQVAVPPADLVPVQRRGRALRMRRRLASTGAVAAVGVLAAGLVVTSPWDRGPGRSPSEEYAALGALDLTEGLRAYADPGGVISLGGREFPGDQLDYLDTDAAATPYGVVFFDSRGRPQLLSADGTVQGLWDGPSDGGRGFHPTAKVDAVLPHVAYAVIEGEQVTLVVQDLATGDVVATRDLECTGDCQDVVVDGIDSGAVFVRTETGTWRWGYERDDDWLQLAGRDTRVADVRNGVVLYDGPAPTLPPGSWRYVAGAIDAQLSYDGSHILYWSPRLRPTGEGKPWTLDVPRGTTFFTFDTDGSVLAATVGSPARFFDCELPSGDCEEIGQLRMTGGDPMFMGDDM